MAFFLGWFGGSRSSSYELDLPQFLKRFRMHVLPVSTDDIVPGAVMDAGGYFSRGYAYQGHLSELMPKVPDSYWETELDRANMVQGSVRHSVNMKGRAGMSQFGINISGGLGRTRAANFRITGIHGRSFANGKGHASTLTLKPLLQKLRAVQPVAYESLVHDFVVMETYYASECTVEFEVETGINLHAEVERAGGVRVGAEGGADWKSHNSFVISQNVEVPFAFRGFRVG